MIKHLSPYQAAIEHWFRHGNGNAIVEATAGSGKTTTLVHLAEQIRGTALFLAFNREIAQELGRRLPPTVVSATLNAFGFKTLIRNGYKAGPEKGKYRDILRPMVEQFYSHYEDDERDEILDVAHDLVEMAQKTLCGYDKTRPGKVNPSDSALRQMALTYDLSVEWWDEAAGLVAPALREGIRLAKQTISFCDQVWLPVVLGLTIERFPWVLVDESQDLNAAQRALACRALAPAGRMLFVGDPWQSIYLFMGAAPESMDEIRQALHCAVLPLSISYRCPKSHVALAAALGAPIEAAPDAIEGAVLTDVDVDLVASQVKAGDLLICRTNAPLVDLCFRLIRDGKAAKIRGKNIGTRLTVILTQIAKQVGKDEFDFGKLDQYLSGYANEVCRQAENDLPEDKAEAAIASVTDRVETIRAIQANVKASSLKELRAAIVSLFSDDKNGSYIWLSSVHKAKGLEAETVVIVEPQLMPHKMAKSPQQLVQEAHIKFVALTRSKNRLILMAPLDGSAGKEAAEEKAA